MVYIGLQEYKRQCALVIYCWDYVQLVQRQTTATVTVAESETLVMAAD